MALGGTSTVEGSPVLIPSAKEFMAPLGHEDSLLEVNPQGDIGNLLLDSGYQVRQFELPNLPKRNDMTATSASP